MAHQSPVGRTPNGRAEGRFFRVRQKNRPFVFQMDVNDHLKEADIVVAIWNYKLVYEVKPLYTILRNPGEAEKQLEKYVEALNKYEGNAIKGKIPQDLGLPQPGAYLYTINDMKYYENFSGTPSLREGLIGYTVVGISEEGRDDRKPYQQAIIAAREFNLAYKIYQQEQRNQEIFHKAFQVGVRGIIWQVSMYMNGEFFLPFGSKVAPDGTHWPLSPSQGLVCREKMGMSKASDVIHFPNFPKIAA